MNMKRLSQEEDIYRRIYGGLAWPGKRSGYAVIVGEERELDHGLGKYPLRVLDEIESSDMVDLIRQCTGLDFYYTPEMWLGDISNVAGRKFIYEINETFQKREAAMQGKRNFRLSHSNLMGLQNAFEYMYNALKGLLNQDRKLLMLGEKSRLSSWLLEPRPAEISSIRIGDYPAIEALSHAAIELERSQFRDNTQRQEVADSDYNILQ